MIKVIKIQDDNTFRYKNINGKIEFNEEDMYILIGHKLFRLYSKNKFRIRYKGLTFKFNLNESKIKVYKKEETECKHKWTTSGVCLVCGLLNWELIESDVNWVTNDIKTFINRYMKNETEKLNLYGKLIILEPVTSISDGAFSYCKKLTSVSIPDSVKTIGNNAFSYCEELTSVSIPDSVKTIGNDAFSDCYKLTLASIPDSLTSIGNYAFYYCTNLDSLIIPDLVTSISEGAFSYCKKLTSVKIPDSVTSIGISAFSGCEELTSVSIPNSVASIGNYAFYNCKKLTSVSIPNSVTEIGEKAFTGCEELTSVSIIYSDGEPDKNAKKEYENALKEAGIGDSDDIEFTWKSSTVSQ